MAKIVLMNIEGWPGAKLAAEMLMSNSAPLDIVEQCIKLTESEESVRTVGFGGAPNAEGHVELDASIMNGDTLEVGAVGALRNNLHPISVARQVMLRLPHVMLVGEGARRFARECGFGEQDCLSQEARRAFEEWRHANFKEPLIDSFNSINGVGSHGTVICLTRNDQGSFAGGVSTSGWDFKYPGRLGDSPIIGAGLYVDSEYGAAACTHCGENAIRASLSRSVVMYLKFGKTLRDAIKEGMKDLTRLKGGYQGQVVIYAVNRAGEAVVARRYEHGNPCEYLIVQDGMTQPERREAEFLG